MLLLLLLISVPHCFGAPTCYLENGIDYHGWDVRNVTVTSTDQCCSLCSSTFGCTSWTIYQNICYMKAGTSGRQACSTCTSGTIQAASVCTVENNINYNNTDLTQSPVNNDTTIGQNECCILCGLTFGCQAWTLYQGICYMKQSNQGRGSCSGCISGTVTSPNNYALPNKWTHSAMTYTGDRYCPNVTLGSAASQISMKHVASTGATWAAVVVTGYTWNIDSTEIFPIYDPNQVKDACNYYTFITETDDSIRSAIRYFHSLGVKVMLKPHIDLLQNNQPCGQYWRGDIGQNFNSSQWSTWFQNYANFFLPYAKIAEDEGAEMLSMNCELVDANRQEQGWRNLVNQTRSIYHGLLTTGANHGSEQEVMWWDILDIVGVDFYYGVPGSNVAQYISSLQQYKYMYQWLSQKSIKKQLTLTEIGYCSGQCSRTHNPSVYDYTNHALHFNSLLEAMSPPYDPQLWWLGAFWWNWDTDPAYGAQDDCLTPQFKPAEDVLRKYYRATQPKPSPPDPNQPYCVGYGKCTS